MSESVGPLKFCSLQETVVDKKELQELNCTCKKFLRLKTLREQILLARNFFKIESFQKQKFYFLNFFNLLCCFIFPSNLFGKEISELVGGL